jgi:hypothetical protein
MRKRVRELEAMLQCSEEWTEFWEREALAAKRKPLVAENYAIPAPASWGPR